MFYYYLLKYGYHLVRFLPLRVGYSLCTVIGWAVFWGNPNVRRAVLGNQRHVLPGVRGRLLRRRAIRVIINQQKNYYDLMRIPYLTSEAINAIVQVEGVEHFEEAVARRKGIIFASPHMGNYNLVTQIAVARGIKAHIIAERLRPPKAHTLINGLRERLGLHLIPLDDPYLARSIFKVLRAGEGLGLAIDRELTGNGAAVTLFGRPAVLPTGPVTLSLRLGVPLLPVQVERLDDHRSIVHIYPILELERTGDTERDVQVGTQQLAHLLERMVRTRPDQWVVLQPIWPEDGGPALPAPTPHLALPAAPTADPAPPAPAPAGPTGT